MRLSKYYKATQNCNNAYVLLKVGKTNTIKYIGRFTAEGFICNIGATLSFDFEFNKDILVPLTEEEIELMKFAYL